MYTQALRVKGELLRFRTADRLLLEGFLLASKRSDTCIIHVHGMTDDFYGSLLPFSFAKKMNRQGVAVFTINTRGHDPVALITRWAHERPDLKAGTDYEKFEGRRLDIAAAIESMRKLGYRKFILSGHSTGCQKSIYYLYKTRDRSVKGLVMLGPGDDHNLAKERLGRRFAVVVSRAKKLVSQKRNVSEDTDFDFFSPRRFLSFADMKNPEARLLNYKSNMTEFHSIAIPTLAIIGSKDRWIQPPKKYAKILEKHSGSRSFSCKIIPGAKHSFKGYEDETAGTVSKWIAVVVK